MTPLPWPLGRDVHLYGLVLPDDAAELDRLESFLAPSETTRAALLKSAEAARRYVAGRGLLREILGNYLGISPRSVRLATGEHGKPCLSDATAPLGFNLAHSGDYFLLAVAADREVGVDIERIDPGRPMSNMARLVFSPREQEEWARFDVSRQADAFCRCWVRKEAFLKACGKGFSLPANRFDLAPLDEHAAVMTVDCHQQQWQVLDLAVPHRYCAALAVASCGSSADSPMVVRVDHRLSFS